MDNKRLFIGMVVMLGLMGAWYLAVSVIDKRHPDWVKERQEAAAKLNEAATQPATSPTSTTAPAVASTGTPTTGRTGEVSGPSISATTGGYHAMATTQPSDHVLLGSAMPKAPEYSLQLDLTPRGAGLSQVTLNEFKKTVTKDDRYVFQNAYADQPGTEPLASTTITIDDSAIDLSGNWNLIGTSADSATFGIDVANGNDPVVHIEKKYLINRRTSPGFGYESTLEYTVKNLTAQPHKVHLSFNGPTTPQAEVERGADRQIIIGYQKDPGQITVEQKVIESFKDSTAQDLSVVEKHPSVWVGAGSVYFSAIVLFKDTPATASAAKTDFHVSARSLTPDSENKDVVCSFDTGAFDLPAGGTAQVPLSLFFGPKNRELLNKPFYADYPRQFNETLVIASGFCGYCTFTWLIVVLVNMLSAFHKVLFHDWGLAIIALVVLVRICLHPITKRSQVQMLKMGKMGPEIERLKKKYGDDKDSLNKAMVGVYKETGVAPILGCLPMVLQTPIWIALWSALQSTFSLRQSPFLWFGPVHLTWINDLSRPDALYTFANPFTLPFLGKIDSINLLPLAMGVVFFLQQKYTPKPAAASPEQEKQQKMMMLMSTLMFPLFLYKGPAGLNLYIFTSTTIGIFESKVIRKHIKDREEAEKATRVSVDVKPTRAAKRLSDKDAAEPKKSGGVMGWLAALQAKAEQIRKDGK